MLQYACVHEGKSQIENSFRLVKEVEFQLCDLLCKLLFLPKIEKERFCVSPLADLYLCLQRRKSASGIKAAIPLCFNLLAG